MLAGIVYESNSGFTKQYAEMLSAAAGIPALPLVEAVSKIPRGSEVFFLGWVCGGKISGLPVAAKRYYVAGTAAVLFSARSMFWAIIERILRLK